MKKLSVLLFLIIMLFLISAPAAPAAMTSFSPAGTTTDNPQLKAVFSSPMVGEDAVGKIVGVSDFPFEISPPIIADGRWESPTVFTADLIAPLPKATAFVVTEAGSRPGGKFNFQTEPLSLISASQASYSLSAGAANVRIKLEFNLPVPPARLASFLTIVTPTNRKLNFSSIGGLPSRTIMLETALTGGNINENKLILTIAKGLTASVGSLALEKEINQVIDVSPVLEIIDTSVSNYDGSIFIETNNRINIEKAQQFITIEPASGFRLESRWNGFAITGDFKPRQRVAVNIKKGLPAADDNTKLPNDFQKAFIIPDRPPTVSFPASGMFLSPSVGTKIPVETVNISDLDITLWRLYESNIPYVLRNEYFRYNFPSDMSARVAKRTAKISSTPNETVRRAIDIKSLVSEEESEPLQGLYLLTANEKGAYSWQQAEQIVSLSDIGLTARIWPGGVLIWANSISQAKPIENALIRIYDASSQRVAHGRTDSQGLCRYFPSDLNAKPVLITAAKEGDVSFIQLNNPLITHETFDTSGRAWVTSGYDGMLFTPRGVYRPGETVNAKAIVREAGGGVPSNFPVLYAARDSMGRTFSKGTADLSAQGAADIEFDLSDTAPTGEYAVELYIPGKEGSPFAAVRFSVESFAPPRIEVGMKRADAEGSFIFKGENAAFEISSKYLFGAPSANMPWSLKYHAVAGDFVPIGEKWAAFKFSDPEKPRNLEPSGGELESGVLDQEGKASASFESAFDWNPPSIVSLTIAASVMEDSGRWITKELPFKYFTGSQKYLLGIEAPPESPVNQTVRFRAAALAPDSAPVEELEVKATLFRVVYHYNLVQRDGVTRWQTTQELEKTDEKTLMIAQGTADFDFTPKSYGEYLVRVEGAGEPLISASSRFWCYDHADTGGSKLIDKIELVPDKASYSMGDTARVTVKAPFAGTLLFTVENSSLIGQQVIDMPGVQVDVFIPISGDMRGPNLWCVASVLRPVKEDEPWTVHRATGVTSIAIDASAQRFPIAIEAPDEITPDSKLRVKIKSPPDSEIVVALVDEGVLQISGYDTPDPHGYFYAKHGLSSNLYDIYDQLMQVEPRSTELLHPAGGLAARAAAFMGSMDARRFRILSIYKPSLIIGPDGEAEFELDIPEYSGKARLYAVGISGMAFGSAEKFVQIARDVVVEANLPRFAAAGDSFSSPLSVFNTSGKSQDVLVSLKTEGPLRMDGEEKTRSFIINIPPKSSETVEISFKADEIGNAKYIVETKIFSKREGEGSQGGQEFSQEIELPVRGLYPVVSQTGTGRFSAGETIITLPGDAAGLTTLTVAGTPVADLVPAVNFLLNYPHGCLEQVVSRAWALLAVPEAVRMTDPELISQPEILNKLSSCISALQTMQLYNGSFASWPGEMRSNDWASVYAAHFLSELKKADIMRPFPEDMFNGVMNFVRQLLAEPADGDNIKEDLTTKAYACFVLALEKEAPLGLMYWLKENSHNLLPSGQIWLAGAYSLEDGKQDHLKELGGVFAADAPLASNPVTLDSMVRNAAQMLLLWGMVQPDAPEAAALAENLIRLGRAGRWYSTQENAAAAVALANYIKNGAEQPATDLDCSLIAPSGEVFAPAPFKAQDNLTFRIPEPGNWTLKSEGTGSGYYSWVVTGEPKEAPRPESHGIKIETEWTDSKGNVITGDIKLGTEIYVSVKVIPVIPLMDVVVSLLLPAGLEIESAPKPEGYRADARDDRLLLFFGTLNDSVEYKYVVRAVTKGNFAVPPQSAEGMYSPATKFIGEGGRVNIN